MAQLESLEASGEFLTSYNLINPMKSAALN